MVVGVIRPRCELRDGADSRGATPPGAGAKVTSRRGGDKKENPNIKWCSLSYARKRLWSHLRHRKNKAGSSVSVLHSLSEALVRLRGRGREGATMRLHGPSDGPLSSDHVRAEADASESAGVCAVLTRWAQRTCVCRRCDPSPQCSRTGLLLEVLRWRESGRLRAGPVQTAATRLDAPCDGLRSRYCSRTDFDLSRAGRRLWGGRQRSGATLHANGRLQRWSLHARATSSGSIVTHATAACRPGHALGSRPMPAL